MMRDDRQRVESDRLIVIGGGLAGVEASFQAARRGIRVDLVEMRPIEMTPAHETGYLAELVCSNSLGSILDDTGAGLLKREMSMLGSITLKCAYACRVPAGSALAVERKSFARLVTEEIESQGNIRIIHEEAREIPAGRPVIISSGPLTSPALAKAIAALTGQEHLYFYDAVAPIITRESIDESKVFWAARYGKGDADYANCPMTEKEYERFWTNLIEAEVVPTREFEELSLFEGCMPIEEIARRGKQALAFGPLRPAGLTIPGTGERPYAVVQLRREDPEGNLLNMVGFQTRLTWPEQRRVFRMIPGLENAEFVRYGVMHRNTFINSPMILLPTLQTRADPGILFAGQVIGVEGYMESAAMGILAGITASFLLREKEPVAPPRETMIGALSHYVVSADPTSFQPMNANFGILPQFAGRRLRNKKERRRLLAERALSAMRNFAEVIDCVL
ncbi:MAG TPA: methylenetetrahydrofolate--tRNA-(uracil(54)-C(5))-methyltransferase (FADH(2)-oxidizing) TrmFO [Firmicutes bacterium]|nr:methylenetetrahydrofolate--tRNA-(uracil(54)-C(5))-methyltransferase (FADH(2)-oxidizing) TrmFO [Bacillota bacterium]HHY99150.1 methylenetetrahydrofolate--tRNA-(uracil(54)-C(5))-methyltransferase (FADH(2)-oxidizing) TrmFO [Bacillota bacterium]